VTRGHHRRWAIAAVVVVGMLAIGLSPAAQRAVRDAAVWCEGAGPLGIVVYGALYSASTVLVFPAAVLTVAAGWAWGLVGGTLIVLGVSLIADWIPFAIARRLGRERVLARVDHARTLRALEEAFRSQGFLLVALLRLSPIAPYNVTNYLLGLTPVSTFTYLTASTLGSIPGVLLIVYAGTQVREASELDHVGVHQETLVLVAAIALVVVSYVAIALIARRALRRIVTTEPARPG
jgi:uncharacterized membrane protein YdjX (TVP38/TMEM64 family)